MKQLVKKIIAKFGYQINKKQILILSDDWGSVRLKSLESRENLRRKGINVEANRFDQFDCLESNNDVELLFEVLNKHKDYLGNTACITAVTNVANPNFSAIKENNFENYVFEKNTETYNRYPNSDKVNNLVLEGIKEKIFIPQSHAREHVQVNWWMSELQQSDSVARKVFDEDFFFLSQPNLKRKDIKGLGASLNAVDLVDFNSTGNIVASSLSLFEEIYGYKSVLFCPPAMRYSKEILPVLKEYDVQWLDVQRKQQIANLKGKPEEKYMILGQKSEHGFRYLVRNVVFETNMSQHDNGVSSCLKGIQEAFNCKQPAIISNHRASFVGGIEEKNREKGLKALDNLLSQILKKWPDVEFITVTDL